MLISWNLPLILLSVMIAIIGSFTALTHAQRMRESSGRTSILWMLAGSSSLGMAVWSMHFVGMLAFQLPTPIGYDPVLTLFSLLPVILSALLGFLVLRRQQVSLTNILVSGLLMGLGVSTMHYLGMAALKMMPAISYDPFLFVLSIIIAIVACTGALLIMYYDNWIRLSAYSRFVLGALVMGVAISSMHYTAMLGMHIPENGMCLTGALRIQPEILAALVTITSIFWFGGGLIASLFDQRMSRKNAQELALLEKEHIELLATSEKTSQAMIAALRESEERLQMTLQNAPDAVFLTEKDGRIMYVNDNVIKLLGYDQQELNAMTVFDLVPPNWRERYRQGGKQITTTNARYVMEIRLVSKDGKVIPMELNAVLLPNGRVYGSCRDIRDRKLVEKALKESQENLQRMMDSMSEGMYGVDIEGNCTFANNAFLRILGYANADEILGKHIHSLIHHTHADGQPYPAVECPMYKSFKIQQPVHCDSEVFWRKDGQAVPVEYWCRQIIKGDKSIGAVTTFMDITERKEKEKHIHNLAFYDGLTGLPNRRLLMERVQRALAVSARNGLYGSIMLLDLDNFKRLNDTKGHDAGDALLCEVSNRLHNIMREGDTVARLGGDEFVVVLESLSAVADEAAIHAEMIAEKIRTALNEPFTLGTDPYQTSPSIGVVLFLGNKENIEALLKYADISMYQSKQAGRNTIRFFDQDMQMAVEARAMLETDIHVALEQQQFRLYYQVQVNINGKPHGAETLIRWHHPNKGLIFPSQFIPVAEETGLIVPIGRWVLEEACAQIACWRNQRKFQKLVISVNVSAKQFRQPDFVELVKSIVTKHAINPMLLKLEMTETLVLENVEDTITKMRALKEFGVGFSMDDFGTGYSSLSYLKRLPLDQLKIDQSFVRNIATDNADIVMVSTIIDLAMNFELDVIAEGVETEAQLNKLHRFGCGSFQGYLFSKPIPVEQFEALIRERD